MSYPLSFRIGALDVMRSYFARQEMAARRVGDFELATFTNASVCKYETILEELLTEATTNMLLYGTSDL